MIKNMGIGRGRPGGNPEFGKSIKMDAVGVEALERHLQVRLTASMDDALKSLGNGKMDFVREALAEALARHERLAERLGRELAAQTVTKIETTELANGQEQQPDNSQTTQLNLELATDPTLGEQEVTPRKQRKERQTQGQKPTKPRSQTRSLKSSATEKTKEQGQPDTQN